MRNRLLHEPPSAQSQEHPPADEEASRRREFQVRVLGQGFREKNNQRQSWRIQLLSDGLREKPPRDDEPFDGRAET